jgi:hypothetical protein
LATFVRCGSSAPTGESSMTQMAQPPPSFAVGVVVRLLAGEVELVGDAAAARARGATECAAPRSGGHTFLILAWRLAQA